MKPSTIATAGLAGVIGWDALGLDLPASRWIADAHGFAWQHAWLTETVLHAGARWLVIAACLAMGVDALWAALRPARAVPSHASDGPSALQRIGWFAVVLLGLVGVPALKRLSTTSCPWDLSEFGGHAAYVPHWLLGVLDGGPGHCFPAGHAAGAFAFFGAWFCWRHHRPTFARAILGTVLVAGATFGVTQWLRGAHYVSHTLWTAWLCWTLCVAADHVSNHISRLVPGIDKVSSHRNLPAM